MTLSDAVAFLDAQISDAKVRLPEEVFLFASRITPLVNVELIVRDERNRTLLAWRDDAYYGAGWHLPGGIVRFKEKIETRIQLVAQHEIGTRVAYDPSPVAILQLMNPTRDTRGHFLSFIFLCSVPQGYVPENHGRAPQDAGFLQWHEACPANLIRVQEIYRPYICARNLPRFETNIGGA